MNQFYKQYRKKLGYILVSAIAICHFISVYGQDDCSNAINIILPGGGFGIGTVVTPTSSLTSATIQTGENFSNDNILAGQNQKSVWYKFSLPTSRSFLISLLQFGSSINDGDVGFAIYKSSACLPAVSDLSLQLKPVTNFGTTNSLCLESGDYIIQVSAKSFVNGSIYFFIRMANSASSPYDYSFTPSNFGLLSVGTKTLDFNVDCQGIDNASEVCTSLSNYTEYTKTTWHVFSTPSYFDYIGLILANQTLPAGQTYGLNIYKGDVRSSAGTLIFGCNSITSNANKSSQKIFTCADLDPNTTYSVQLFYHQNFTDNVQLSLITGGTSPTAAPKPLLSGIPASNRTTLTPSASGITVTLSDYLACNSRHSITNCPPSLPPAGTTYNNRNFNLSSFFAFTLTSAASLNLSATPSCGPPLLLQLYQATLTNNCSDLNAINLVKQSTGVSSSSCLGPGNYVVQVSGTDSSVENTYGYGTLTSSPVALCLLSNLGGQFSLNITASTPSAINQNIDSSLCADQSYVLSNGTTVNTSNTYRDTLRTINGCDSVIRILNLNFKNKTVQSSSVLICSGASYTLPSGKMITAEGIYNDTLHYTSGCDSVINIITVSAKPAIRQIIDSSICEHSSFVLPSGFMVTTGGNYFDTVRYNNGCDSLTTELHLSVKNTAIENNIANICAGKNYTLPWGTIVSTAGVYKDTLHYNTGCDSVIRVVTVSIQNPSIQYLDTTICEGNIYILPWGTVASNAGFYSDTLHFTTGCDSLIRSVQLKVKAVVRKDSSIAICTGQTFIAPSGFAISSQGIYFDTLRYATGCDSVIYRLYINEKPADKKSITAFICDGGNYVLPSGDIISSPGNYFDTLRYASGCDSIIYSIQLISNSTQHQNTSVNICSGQTYTLPWGTTVTSQGNYSDTLHYATGCDSLIRLVQITVNTPTVLYTSATICDGASYTLPSGVTVNAAGIYKDTLRFLAGCDSLVRIVNLAFSPVLLKQSSISLCEGSSVSLPWGIATSTPGIYRDTLHYTNGCDSVINEITVLLNAITRTDTTVSFCAGNTYLLPWGVPVTIPGTYKDTLHYLSGCDSVIRTVQLTATTLTTITTATSICSNQNFTLPWGTIVSVAGIYRDTLRYTSGCDSLIRVVDLSVNTPAKQIIDTSICFDGIYTLPWGTVAALPGTYADTLHAIGGCDSLIKIVTLSITPVVMKDTAAVLCSGQFFLSSTGNKIYSAGLYFDTLRNKSGCDRMIFRISINDKPVVYKTIDASACYGQWYKLPSGKKINMAGTYLDTLQYKGGCDSLVTTVNLSVLTAQTQSTAASVCPGKGYTLPWGTIATAPGNYSDTLKNTLGCDSLVRTVLVTVTMPARLSISAAVCVGHNFTAPSGKPVTKPGNFSDTIYNAAGCDSVIFDINLTTITPVTQSSNITICAGRTYTLPWGPIVNSGGVYRDTVRSISGCDSIYRAATLAIFAPAQNTITASVCYGKAYTLPSGKTVFAAGLYKDTLLSSSGCDSIITTVALTIQAPATLSMRTFICAGQPYTLPWGKIVNAAGFYRDTLKYTTGCDSLIRIVNVQTISAKTASTNASFCRGENYVLPWGTVVNNAGAYSDTLRTTAGCDSVIRIVNLALIEKPVVSVSKSNDINCTLGSAKLTATGGNQYQWSPAVGLDKTDVFNPVAAPAISTLYHVKASSTYGCSSEDSILVLVTTANSGESFLMPNAFTPNGDNLNDCFGVRHWGAISNLHFSIYDRWGKLVFYTENPSQCWDGLNKDKQLPAGTYVYAITAKTMCGDVMRKGTVTLIR